MEAIINSQSATCSWLQSIKTKSGIYYTVPFGPGQTFTIRSLDMEKDLAIIHQWVNEECAIRYWNMEGSIDMLDAFYCKVLGFDFCHSFIGCLNGEAICQMDAYDPVHDTLGSYYQVLDGDIGIHLLLGSRKSNISNLSAKIVSAFARWFFNANEIQRIVAEPDHQNRAANWLLRRLQFEWLGKIELPEKTASLFAMTKEKFATNSRME